MAPNAISMNAELLSLALGKIPKTRGWQTELHLDHTPLPGSHNKPLVCNTAEMVFARLTGDQARMIECLDWWEWYVTEQPISGGESLTPEEVYRSMMIYSANLAAAIALIEGHKGYPAIMAYTRAHVAWLALGAGAGPGRKVTDHHLNATTKPCVLIGDGKPIWDLPYIAQAGARGWVRNREKKGKKTFHFTDSSGLSVTVGQAAQLKVPRKPNTWQADMLAATLKLAPHMPVLGFDANDIAALKDFLRRPSVVALVLPVVAWVKNFPPMQPHSFIRYEDDSILTIMHKSHRSSTDARMVDMWLAGGKTLKTSADDGLRSSSAPQTAVETEGAVVCTNPELGMDIIVQKPFGRESYRVVADGSTVKMIAGQHGVDLGPDPAPVPPSVPPAKDPPKKRKNFWGS